MIDLENFERGWNEEQPKKGKVLFTANVTEKPYFEQFQRVARSDVRDRFMGFFGGNTNVRKSSNNTSSGYDSDDDDFYLRSKVHQSKFGRGKKHRVCFCACMFAFRMLSLLAQFSYLYNCFNWL